MSSGRARKAGRDVAHPSPDERAARGKAARAEVPRASHAEWEPSPDRPDPVELLEQQARTRVPELVPIRYGRMLVSPFTFYRGAAPDHGRRSGGDAAHRAARAALRRRAPVQLRRRSRHPTGGSSFERQRLRRDASRARSSGTSSGSSRASPSPAATAASTQQAAARDRPRGRPRRTARRCASSPAMRTLDVWYARIDVDELDRSCAAPSATPKQLKRVRARTSRRPARRTACARSRS